LKIFTLLAPADGQWSVSYCFEVVTRRSAFWFGRFTFGDDGVMEFCAEGVRKLVDLVLAVNFNGLLGCVAHDVAIVAPSEMFLKFSLQVVVQRTFKKIIQLG
jgi:hypothetical protein